MIRIPPLRDIGLVLTLAICLTSGCTGFLGQVADVLPGHTTSTTRESQLELGRLQERQGKLTSAREIYADVLGEDPDNPRALHRMGIVSARLGEAAQADSYFQRAMTLAPLDGTVKNDYGYALFLAGDLERSEQVLRCALQDDADDERVIVNLAMVVEARGRTDESFELFRRVGSVGEAHANVGYLLAQCGDVDGAVEQYRLAVAADPELRSASHALLQLAERRRQRDLLLANTTRHPAEIVADSRQIASAATMTVTRADFDARPRTTQRPPQNGLDEGTQGWLATQTVARAHEAESAWENDVDPPSPREHTAGGQAAVRGLFEDVAEPPQPTHPPIDAANPVIVQVGDASRFEAFLGDNVDSHEAFAVAVAADSPDEALVGETAGWNPAVTLVDEPPTVDVSSDESWRPHAPASTHTPSPASMGEPTIAIVSDEPPAIRAAATVTSTSDVGVRIVAKTAAPIPSRKVPNTLPIRVGAGAETLVEKLEKQLGEGSSLSRMQAAHQLRYVDENHAAAIETISRFLVSGTDDERRFAAMCLASGPATASILPILKRGTQDRLPEVHVHVMLALARHAEFRERAVTVVREYLADPEPEIRLATAVGIERAGLASLFRRELLERVNGDDEDVRVRETATEAL